MKPTTTIYLTRHGETEWNVQQRMQGHQDSPLTALGVKQAEWLSRGLLREPIDVIYTSPSYRTQRTAEIIRGERELPVYPAEAFMEIGMGPWEGRNTAELKEAYAEPYRNFWEDPEKFKLEGGETFAQVQARALEKLQEILLAHEGQSVLIVTHTVVIKLLMAYWEQRNLLQLWDLPYIYPTCLCQIEFAEGTPRILLHGDTSHYEESEAGMEA